MVEPVSIVAAALGLTGSAWTICEQTYRLINGIRGAPAHVARIAGDLQALCSVLWTLHAALAVEEEKQIIGAIPTQMAENLQDLLRNCMGVFLEIQKVVQPFTTAQGTARRGPWKMFTWERYKKDEILLLQNALGSYKLTLNIACSSLTLLNESRTQDMVEHLHQEICSLRVYVEKEHRENGKAQNTLLTGLSGSRAYNLPLHRFLARTTSIISSASGNLDDNALNGYDHSSIWLNATRDGIDHLEAVDSISFAEQAENSIFSQVLESEDNLESAAVPLSSAETSGNNSAVATMPTRANSASSFFSAVSHISLKTLDESQKKSDHAISWPDVGEEARTQPQVVTYVCSPAISVKPHDSLHRPRLSLLIPAPRPYTTDLHRSSAIRIPPRRHKSPATSDDLGALPSLVTNSALTPSPDTSSGCSERPTLLHWDSSLHVVKVSADESKCSKPPHVFARGPFELDASQSGGCFAPFELDGHPRCSEHGLYYELE